MHCILFKDIWPRCAEVADVSVIIALGLQVVCVVLKCDLLRVWLRHVLLLLLRILLSVLLLELWLHRAKLLLHVLLLLTILRRLSELPRLESAILWLLTVLLRLSRRELMSERSRRKLLLLEGTRRELLRLILLLWWWRILRLLRWKCRILTAKLAELPRLESAILRLLSEAAPHSSPSWRCRIGGGAIGKWWCLERT